MSDCLVDNNWNDLRWNCWTLLSFEIMYCNKRKIVKVLQLCSWLLAKFASVESLTIDWSTTTERTCDEIVELCRAQRRIRYCNNQLPGYLGRCGEVLFSLLFSNLIKVGSEAKGSLLFPHILYFYISTSTNEWCTNNWGIQTNVLMASDEHIV